MEVKIREYHGGSHTRLYACFKNMRKRILNPEDAEYPNYGGRGISICEEWSTFDAFRSWAYDNGYSETLTIERRDVNGDYCPDNCHWVDMSTQAANKRKRSNTKQKYKGIYSHQGKFRAQIEYRGQMLMRKMFNTEEEALEARNAYIKEHNLPHIIQ